MRLLLVVPLARRATFIIITKALKYGQNTASARFECVLYTNT